MFGLVINTDCNGEPFYTGRLGNLTLDTFYTLDKSPKYGSRYDGLLRAALDIYETPMEREQCAKRVLSLLGKEEYKVSCFDFEDASLKTVRRARIAKETKEVLGILENLQLKNVNFFTHSDERSMILYASKIFRLMRPRTVIRVYASQLDSYEGELTGNTVGPIWNSQRRASRARELTGDRFSVNFGNGESDLPLLRVGSRSYYLTSYTTAGKIGTREGNVIYTTLPRLPPEIRNLSKEILPVCKWSVRSNQNRRALQTARWKNRCGL